MRQDRKGNTVVVAIALLLIIGGILAAFVIPWTLSLVDAGRTSSRHHVLSYHLGSTTIMSASTPITFYKQVDVDSVVTWLTWDEDDAVGTCTAWVQFQSNNQVGGYATVTFIGVPYSSGDWYLEYLGVPTGPRVLVPGDYLMALTVMCSEPNQVWWWHEIYSLPIKYNASVVHPETYALIDHDPYNGFWEENGGGERQYQNPAYVLEGGLSGPDLPPEDPEDPEDPQNKTNKTTVPPLIDAALGRTGMEYEDWIPWILIGAIALIVMVAVVVLIRL